MDLESHASNTWSVCLLRYTDPLVSVALDLRLRGIFECGGHLGGPRTRSRRRRSQRTSWVTRGQPHNEAVKRNARVQQPEKCDCWHQRDTRGPNATTS